MADVRKDPQDLDRASIPPTYHSGLSTSDVYLVANNGRTFLHFKKTGAGICTVTISTPGTVDGLAVADLTFTVPATTGDKFIGPFPREIYNDSVGDLRVSCSEVTGLSFAVLRI